MVRIRWAQIVATVTLVSVSLSVDRTTANEFTIFASEKESAALSKTLCPDKPDSVQIVSSIQKAVDSESDVLVLFLPHKFETKFDSQTITKLRDRKVIGIGYGAAQVFGTLGLEIKGGACAHNGLSRAPGIQVEDTPLSPKLKAKKLVAFRLGDKRTEEVQRGNDYNFAMYLPRKQKMTQFVEAIARWPGDENYAPIVKQGNHIMVGIAAPPQTWTKEYSSFFADLAKAFAKQPDVPFSRAKWEITRPGEHGFKLAKGQSTEDPSNRTFYFRFNKPTKFSASLRCEGSEAIMLLFMGENKEHWTRRNGIAGMDLQINVEISAKDIQSVGEGYWSLNVTNFDRGNLAKCKLKIEY